MIPITCYGYNPNASTLLMPLEQDFIYIACGVLALIAMSLALVNTPKGVGIAKAANARPQAAAAVVLTVTPLVPQRR